MLEKKLLPEVPQDAYKKICDRYKKGWKKGTPAREKHIWTTWITNITFLFYESVEQKGYKREDILSLTELRELLKADLNKKQSVEDVVLLLLQNCFGVDIETKRNDYYSFMHPKPSFGGEERLCYPGGPTNRRNKHIFH